MVSFEATDGEVKMGAIKVGASFKVLAQETGTSLLTTNFQGNIRESLSIPCYVINPPGTNTGYVAFQRSLAPEEYDKFVSSASSIQGVTYSWQKLSEDEEKPLQKDYVLQSIQRLADDSGGGGKGGRSGRGGRGGGRGGKYGGRDGSRNKEKAEKERQNTKTGKENGTSTAGMEVDPLSGAKRKREGEPDGPEKGERGSGPAVIKKIRVE
jgi:lupus La protein